MFDLNIDAGNSGATASCEGETHQTADADSVTTTTTCTTNNAAFAADDEPDSSSSTRRNFNSTLNFSILHEDAIEIKELQLFPVRTLSSSPVDSAKHRLNLPAPEVSCGGGAELGIFKAQLPSNNRALLPPAKKSRRGPRSRSSPYRGVTFYRRTGRWESHIWDSGKQVYLGGFDTALAAARTYDRAAVKFRGVDADINFSVSDYEEDIKQVKNLSKEEFVQLLRRKSNGFSRGSSKYGGVTLHRMGQFFQEKVYHDKATIICNQRESLTKFQLINTNSKREINSTTIGGGSGRNLDLDLGISLSSDVPQRNYTTSNLHFHHASSESPYGKGVKVQASSSASFQGLVTATKYAPARSGIYSVFSPKSKERAMAMSAEATSLPGISNWCHFLCPAASSGFSSTTTPRSNS